MVDFESQVSALKIGKNQQIRELIERVEELQQSVSKLELLNLLVQEISSSHDIDKIIDNIINRSIQAVGAEQGTITIFDEDGSKRKATSAGRA